MTNKLPQNLDPLRSLANLTDVRNFGIMDTES